MYLTFHSSLKESKTAREVLSEMEIPTVEIDQSMRFEDYLCIFLFGIVFGADAVLIYLVR